MQDLVKELSQLLLAQNKMLVSAESCTGGLIASQMTQRSGSSQVFERGYVTYSNEAKQDCLGVSAQSLEQYGAVSEQVAEEMALGALKNSRAQIAVSVTGIAGPGGGSDEKPVGLVYLGFAQDGKVAKVLEKHFTGDRHAVQNQTARCALEELIGLLS